MGYFRSNQGNRVWEAGALGGTLFIGRESSFLLNFLSEAVYKVGVYKAENSCVLLHASLRVTGVESPSVGCHSQR